MVINDYAAREEMKKWQFFNTENLEQTFTLEQYLKMARKRILVTIIILIGLLSTGKGQPISFTNLPPSEIDIPIKVSLLPFYQLTEKKVDTVFTSPNYPADWIQADCATRYKYYFKRSPLKLAASGASFHLSFTGYYKIIGSTRVCVNGAILSPWTPPCQCGFGEGERKVNIGFSSTFKLHPHYLLQTKITRTEPVSQNKCTVCFWGQDITATVIDGLKKELDLTKKAMEDSFGTVNLRPYFQQAWNKLSEVYTIPGFGYLSLQPKNLRMQTLTAKDDLLNIHIGISASPVISLLKPENKVSVVPNLTSAANNEGFSIYLEAGLQYDSLGKVLNTYLANKRFDMQEGFIKKHIIIKDTKVAGDASGNLFIQMNFTGSHNGTFYFTGKPAYNKETQTIEVKELQYDLKTNDFLLKTAKWLFNKKIITELTKHTQFQMAAYYDTAAKILNTWLNKEWTKGIKGTGTVTNISLTEVYALPQHLLIRSNCVGKLSVQVSEIELIF